MLETRKPAVSFTRSRAVLAHSRRSATPWVMQQFGRGTQQSEKVVPNTEINDTTVFPLELNTMPGWAGSSWYFNRYMDADNT